MVNFRNIFAWVSITSSPRIKQNSITTHGQPYTNWQLNIETCQQIPRPNVDQLGFPPSLDLSSPVQPGKTNPAQILSHISHFCEVHGLIHWSSWRATAHKMSLFVIHYAICASKTHCFPDFFFFHLFPLCRQKNHTASPILASKIPLLLTFSILLFPQFLPVKSDCQSFQVHSGTIPRNFHFWQVKHPSCVPMHGKIEPSSLSQTALQSHPFLASRLSVIDEDGLLQTVAAQGWSMGGVVRREDIVDLGSSALINGVWKITPITIVINPLVNSQWYYHDYKQHQ